MHTTIFEFHQILIDDHACVLSASSDDPTSAHSLLMDAALVDGNKFRLAETRGLCEMQQHFTLISNFRTSIDIGHHQHLQPHGIAGNEIAAHLNMTIHLGCAQYVSLSRHLSPG